MVLYTPVNISSSSNKAFESENLQTTTSVTSIPGAGPAPYLIMDLRVPLASFITKTKVTNSSNGTYTSQYLLFDIQKVSGKEDSIRIFIKNIESSNDVISLL